MEIIVPRLISKINVFFSAPMPFAGWSRTLPPLPPYVVSGLVNNFIPFVGLVLGCILPIATVILLFKHQFILIIPRGHCVVVENKKQMIRVITGRWCFWPLDGKLCNDNGNYFIPCDVMKIAMRKVDITLIDAVFEMDFKFEFRIVNPMLFFSFRNYDVNGLTNQCCQAWTNQIKMLFGNRTARVCLQEQLNKEHSDRWNEQIRTIMNRNGIEMLCFSYEIL